MFSAAILALAAALPSAFAGSCGLTLIDQDWNKYGGSYKAWSKDQAQEDFPLGKLIRTSAGEEKATGFIFAKRYDMSWVGEGNLKVLMPKGCVKSENCGLQFDVRLPTGVQEATLSYRLKFEGGYHWTKGGKLPGLCSDDCPVACSPPTPDEGWSTRSMFREGGELMSYSYFQDQGPDEWGKDCGINWYYDESASAGAWLDVRMYIKMNTPGQSNGVEKVWINGKPSFSKTGIEWRADSKFTIEKFTFRSFHGGSDPADFAPDHDQYLWFDDILIQEGECAPGSGQNGRASFEPVDWSEKGSVGRPPAPGRSSTEPKRPPPPRPPPPRPPPPPPRAPPATGGKSTKMSAAIKVDKSWYGGACVWVIVKNRSSKPCYSWRLSFKSSDLDGSYWKIWNIKKLWSQTYSSTSSLQRVWAWGTVKSDKWPKVCFKHKEKQEISSGGELKKLLGLSIWCAK